MEDFRRKVTRFRSLGREMRLQLLLNYARKFPELPPELEAARDAGMNRVHECQAPVFLWVAVDAGAVTIHADVPREAPTVRGFLSFLMEGVRGGSPEEVAALSEDLLHEMGMDEVLGPTRSRGLGAIIRRVKHDVARAAEGDPLP